MLERAAEQTPTQFRASVKRAVLRVASPAEEEHAHTDAVAERRVVCFAEERGMATVSAYLSAEDAATVIAALDAVAYETIHGKGGDTRTADQRRADALVDLCCGVLADPYLVKAHGQRPSIQVTIAASTLMGLDDQPAELDGYGAITAAMARRIASDPTAQWRVLLTDDDGLVTAAGSRTYRPPADMTRTVIARDVHCCFPGCRRTARYNDLDHIQAYQTGRPDHPGEPDVTMPPPPPAQTLRRLDRHPRRHHRHHHLDRPNAAAHYRTRPPTRPTTTTGTGTTTTETTPPASHPGSQPRHHETPARTRPRAATVLTRALAEPPF